MLLGFGLCHLVGESIIHRPTVDDLPGPGVDQQRFAGAIDVQAFGDQLGLVLEDRHVDPVPDGVPLQGLPVILRIGVDHQEAHAPIGEPLAQLHQKSIAPAREPPSHLHQETIVLLGKPPPRLAQETIVLLDELLLQLLQRRDGIARNVAIRSINEQHDRTRVGVSVELMKLAFVIEQGKIAHAVHSIARRRKLRRRRGRGRLHCAY